MAHGRLTIGLGIGRDAVRAVALRRGRIAWAVERARGDEPLVRTIGLLLADAPLPRWPRARVIAAVGPSHAQTKRLSGIPPWENVSQLDDMIRESTARFFLKNGVPLLTIWKAAGEGAPWGAALEAPVLDAIEEACRTRGVTLKAIVPTVAALGAAADLTNGAGQVSWSDGDLILDIAFRDGELAAVRRTAQFVLTSEQRESFAATSELGQDGSRFADALGAARTRRDAVLAWRGRRSSQSGPLPRWRITLAAMAAVLAGAAMLAVPGVLARVAERAAVQRLTAIAPARRDVAFAERELVKLTSALGEVAAFDASRYPMPLFLADVTRAMPDQSAIVSLRLTRDAGNLVALSPRAAALLVKLEAIPGIAGAEIVGPVTREVLADKTLERVTIRFRVIPDERRGTRPEQKTAP